jgi:predicted transcriptional regulator
MTAQKTVDLGNAHLNALMGYTKTMVAANVVPSREAPALMHALSDVMLAALDKFEDAAFVTAKAAAAVRGEDGTETSHSAKPKKVTKTSMKKTEENTKHKEPKVPKFSKTAKMREALTRDGEISEVLPALVAAYRYVAPKRGVGRPRKDEPKPVLTMAQLAFDRAFLAAHPVIDGLNEENSVATDGITVLFDGKKLKMIGRHLFTRYGITVDDYRRIYSLDSKYPSCATGYSDERSRHAKNQGLGTTKVPKTPKASISSGEEALINRSVAVPRLAVNS